MFGSKLIKMSCDFLESKHRDYIPSEKLQEGCLRGVGREWTQGGVR
jgi:hypothetical protein